MATPITWQNIRGADPSEASRPLEAAQRAFSGMFDSFGGVLAKQQNVNEQNWQNTRTNNTNAFLDQLAAYRTPEELAAAQQSGALTALRQRFGPQIDTAAIRGAEEQRVNQLRSGAKQAGEFQDWSTDRAQAGTKDQIKSLIAAGKFDEANALLQQNELRNESELELGLRNMRQQVKVEGQQDTNFQNGQTRFKWDGEMQPLDLAAKRASTAASLQSAAESRARVQHMGDEAKDRRGAAAAAKQAASMGDKALALEKENGAYSMGKYGTKEGKAQLYAALKLIPGLDDGDKEDIVYNLEKYYKDGIAVPSRGEDGKVYKTKMPLPISAIVQAIEGTEDSWFTVSSRRGDRVAAKLAERFGLRDGTLANFDTPRKDFEDKYDKELVNSMSAYQSALTASQLRMRGVQQGGTEAKKAQTR